MLRFLGQALAAGVVAFALVTLFTSPGASLAPRPVVIGSEAPPASIERREALGSYSAAARKAIPSVVNVYAITSSPQLPSPFARPDDGGGGLGSGVVISKDGYILTNNHVIVAGGAIAVSLGSGKPAPARIVGTDPETDLAVLKIEASELQPIEIGDSEQVQIGDVVLAIGNPFGVGQTVTQGIVSGTGRNRVGINTFENFIQTDAAINPGNSGGALVDSAGRLIGINTAILSPSGGSLGIGFAIPTRTAVEVMKQLIEAGRVARGWIGVEAQDLTLELAGALGRRPGPGSVVTRLLPSGPADKGGLRPGDLITAVDGKSVADTRDLVERTAGVAPGAIAQFTVVRGDRELNLRLEMGRRPPLQAARRNQ